MKQYYFKITEDELQTFRHCYNTVVTYYDEIYSEIQALKLSMQRIEKRHKNQKIVKIYPKK